MRTFILAATVIVLSGCVGKSLELNTIEKVNNLSPGMTFQEVVVILGKPKSSSFVGDMWVLKYSLHEYWKGWVPFYVAVDKKSKKVTSWYVDEAEYQRNQQKWMEIYKAMAPPPTPAGGRSSSGGSGGQAGTGGYYPTATGDAGSYESYDTFEADSAGYPGGAYQNPSSGYYDYSTYGD